MNSETELRLANVIYLLHNGLIDTEHAIEVFLAILMGAGHKVEGL